jgi:hypothetical protein
VTLKGANPETVLLTSKSIKDLYEGTRPRDLTFAEIDALTKATHPLPATSTLARSALASHLVAAHGNVLAIELLASNDEGLQRRHELLHAAGASDHSHEPKGRRVDLELERSTGGSTACSSATCASGPTPPRSISSSPRSGPRFAPRRPAPSSGRG